MRKKLQPFIPQIAMPTGLLLIALIVSLVAVDVAAQDSLSIRINRVATDSVSIRGRDAALPYPVLSFITVTDNNGNHVTGLSDTSTWLGPDDVAPNGRLMRDIWQPREYFQSDPSQPLIQDLFAQHIPATIIEITETSLPIIPNSTLLMLDESSSFGESLEAAKDGSRLFIEGMRTVDRTGIIRFSGDYLGFNAPNPFPGILFQPFTSDTTILNADVDSSFAKTGSPVIQSLDSAITKLAAESSFRRSIIAFTDGRNNKWVTDVCTPEGNVQAGDINLACADSLVKRANAANITIHIIADNTVPGEPVNEQFLTRLTDGTGGLFRVGASGDLTGFYEELLAVTNNYYVMAHTSPVPCDDGVSSSDPNRIVDVAANENGLNGSATNSYFYDGPVNSYDLSVTKLADVTSVRAGDSFSYDISVINSGPNTAYNVTLVDSLPDYLTPANFIPAPDSTVGDISYWRFDSVTAGNLQSITYSVTVSATIDPSITEIVTGARLIAACDLNPDDNIFNDSIPVLPPPDPVLTLTQRAVADSFIVSNGDTTWYPEVSETYTYVLTVTNTGTVTATNVTLTDVAPDSVIVTDPLDWSFGDMGPGESQTVSFDATVVDEIPFDQFALDNEATADADNLPTPVSDTLTVFAIDPPDDPVLLTQLDVTQRAVADSFTVDNGDTTWYPLEGETYTYILTVTNNDSITAEDVTLDDVIPDSVTVEAGTALSWDFGDMPPGASETVTFAATVVDDVPFNEFPLLNTASADASNLDPPLVGTITSELTVFAIQIPDTTEPVLTLSQRAEADSFTVANDDTTWYPEVGETYTYILTVRNEGTVIATDVTLNDLAPDSVTVTDPLDWSFGNMDPGESRTVSFDATVVDVIPFDPFPLDNEATVDASNLPIPVTDILTVFAIDPPGTVDPELTLTQRAVTDSFVVDNGDTTWYPEVSETYTYVLTVTNTGTVTATNVALTDIAPDSVSVTDPLDWSFGDMAPGESQTVSFDATVVDAIPFDQFPLDNEAAADADNLPVPVTDTLTVFAIDQTDIPDLDVSVKQRVTLDYRIENGDTTWLVLEDQVFTYTIIVTNEADSSVARNVGLQDRPSGSVMVLEAPDAILVTDELVEWSLGDLDPGESVQRMLTVQVIGEHDIDDPPLENIAVVPRVAREPLSALDNNFSQLDVLVVPPTQLGADLTLRQIVMTDSLQISGSDTVAWAFAGEVIDYEITVINKDSIDAINVVLSDTLPDLVTSDGFNGGDVITWTFDTLRAFADTTVIFSALVDDQFPFTPWPLVNKAYVEAENEGPTRLFDNRSTSTAQGYVDPARLTDIEVTMSVDTDSMSVENGATTYYVEPGERYTYTVTVTNISGNEARNVFLRDNLPNFVSTVSGSVQPAAATENADSLVWNLGTLAGGGSIALQFDVTVPADMPVGRTTLTNAATGRASNENPALLANNSASISVINEVRVFAEECLFLDFNVFEPERGLPLGMEFQLVSGRFATINIMDITGYKVRELYAENFDAGLNRREWDGRMEDGQQVGSGVYIITFQSAGLSCWRKVIIRK